MEKVTREAFTRAEIFVRRHGRNLEKARFAFLFKGEGGERVIDELRASQNEDGGFGQGLEPDFSLPASSPLATSIAFQILNEINYSNGNLIRGGITYLCSTINKERNGWYAVPPEVNNFPHAPWWEYDPDKGRTVIDNHWGNPSAEIVGHLLRYRKYHDFPVENAVKYALTYLLNKKEFNSEHEIYCFISLFNNLPHEKKVLMEKKLTDAVQSLVCTDPEKWKFYVPQPVHFVSSPEAPTFGIRKRDIDKNLAYLVSMVNENGVIYPNWKWGQYETFWKRAKVHWTGILTVKTLKVLSKFDRIDW